MAEGSSKLSEEQIFEFLKTLNVPVRMSDVKIPNKEFIVRVFEYFLRDLQVDMNELKSWETVSHLEDFAIYEEPAFLISLAMIVNHITSPLELNITVKDIVEPKPKRTKKILNYLLVFWNYYLVRCARFHALRDSYEEEVKKAEDLIQENQSLDEKYSEMIQLLNSMQPSKEELCDIVSVKQEKVSKLEKESKAAVDDYNALKVEQTKLCEEINNIQVDIAATEKAIHELEQHILSSPSRINNELQNLTDKIKAEDQKVKEWENKCKEAEKRLQDLDDIMLEDEKVSKVLTELLESINSLRMPIRCLSCNVSSVVATVIEENIHEKIREKVNDIVIYHKRLCEEEEKLKRLQMDLNRKEESTLQQDQMCAKLKLNSKKHAESVKEMLKIYSEQEASLVQEIENLKTKESSLQQSIDDVSNSILETIEKLKEADVKSKMRSALYVFNMENIKRAFQSDCDLIQKAINKKFLL